VNETELIRRQIALEQQHTREALALCQGQPDRELAAACIAYLQLIESRVRARSRAHARRLMELGALDEAESARVVRALTSPENAGDIKLEELDTYTSNIMTYLDSVAHLDALAAARYGLSDWRAVAALDADAVLDERRRYAALSALAASRALGSQ